MPGSPPESLIPIFAGPRGHRPAWLFRRATASLRPLPDFIIIGAQRCGTTSLYRYLERHPDVAPAAVKEIHYFDWGYGRGTGWYRAHFPSAPYRRLRAVRRGRIPLTGEASPYYVYHPRTPERVFRTVPRAKLILVLRNPVDRAFSHYQHALRFGLEDAPTFAEALDREPRRLAGEEERLLTEEGAVSVAHCHHSYLARGIYVDQLAAWRRHFPAEQLLVLRSEEFFAETPAVFQRVLDFLGLSPWQCLRHEVYNRIEAPRMDRESRRRLEEYFAPHNRRLEEYLGESFGWDE